MAKVNNNRSLSTAQCIVVFAFLMTVFFVLHAANFSSVFDSRHQTKTLPKLRKQTTSEDKNIPYIGREPLNHDVAEPIENTNEVAVHPTSKNKEEVSIAQQDTIDNVVDISLTGFKNHSILYLSDAIFASTSIDQLMKNYGESDGGGSCSGDFGNALVNRWRDTKQSYCDQNNPIQPNKLNSHIDCHFVRQTRHHGNGDQLCVMSNVMVNLGLFNDEKLTTSVIKKYVDTTHAHQPYVPFPQDFIQGDCRPHPDTWKVTNQPGWNADLTVKGYTHSIDLTSSECDVWIEHPVLLQQRDTFANFFHDSEDFVNVFLALGILKWNMNDVQLMLTDLYPQGPFWDMWSRVYSRGHPALTAWDIKQLYKQVGRAETEFKNKVCFRELAIGIYGPAAPVTVASWDTPCKKTALVRAYSDFVIRGLGLQDKTHYARSKPDNTIVITYMARRASKEWPERKYCDTEHSFFTCSLWDHFGERALGRMIRNDAEVSSALKSLEDMDWSKEGVKVRFQDVDYNVLTFQEQIEIDLQTDIMIGPHGAGLMHNIFMRDRAALIELFVDGSSVNRHFHNLAFWYGRKYSGVGISNPIDVEQLKSLVVRQIKDIDITNY